MQQPTQEQSVLHTHGSQPVHGICVTSPERSLLPPPCPNPYLQLAECAMGHASELTPEQVRNLCVSFAKLGYFNTQFKSVMADAVIEKLGQYDPALLADTAWAFGEALYYDYDLMTNLHTYLQANADKFDASGLAKVRRGTCGPHTPAAGHAVPCCGAHRWLCCHSRAACFPHQPARVSLAAAPRHAY